MEELRRWLRTSSAPTIGDVASFGARPWGHLRVGDYALMLNADTKRAAVETFVRDPGHTPERPWRVVANQRGGINKVLPGEEHLPGWYAYLTTPARAETVL